MEGIACHRVPPGDWPSASAPALVIVLMIITSRKIAIAGVSLVAIGYAVHIYFEYVGASKNRFLMLRQDDLRDLGKRIQDHVRDSGDYPDSFEDLIKAGRMSRDEVEFVRDGRRVSRTYNRPRGVDPVWKDVIVVENYDFLEGLVNTLAVDGHVCLQRTGYRAVEAP